MKAFYKRIVTLGMISLTSILAWVYCLLEYRDMPAYIIGISLVFIGSMYALLNAVIDVKATKEDDIKGYIDVTVKNAFSALAAGGETAEKLNKASYIQLRKLATTLERFENTNELNAQGYAELISALAESIDKTVKENTSKTIKAVVKYNEINNNKVIEAIEKLDNNFKALSDLIELSSAKESEAFENAIKAVSDELAVIKNLTNEISEKEFTTIVEQQVVAAPTVDTGVKEKLPEVVASDTENIAVADTDDSDDSAHTDDTDTVANVKKEIDEEEAQAKEPENTVVEEVAVTDDTNEASKADDTTPAKTVEPLDADDPNRLLSPDDIAALFASAAPAEEEASEGANVSLGHINSDKVAEEEPASQELELDPADSLAFLDELEAKAKQEAEPAENSGSDLLSQDDIAALFEESKERYRANSDDDFHILDHPESMDQSLIDALLGSADDVDSLDDLENELDEVVAKAEDTEDASLADVIPFPSNDSVTPVSDDPNKQLSPDEIAALFAQAAAPANEAASEEPKIEEPKVEEPVAVTPVSDDPNKQLSPEEIAALFASVQ